MKKQVLPLKEEREELTTMLRELKSVKSRIGNWLDNDEAPMNEAYSIKLEKIYDNLFTIMSDIGEMIGYQRRCGGTAMKEAKKYINHHKVKLSGKWYITKVRASEAVEIAFEEGRISAGKEISGKKKI